MLDSIEGNFGEPGKLKLQKTKKGYFHVTSKEVNIIDWKTPQKLYPKLSFKPI